MKKYILILGAGLMQRPSFEAAKELGYDTLVVDANPDAVCVPYADRFEKIDLKDKEAIAEFALSLKDQIAAVFTAGTDFSASVSYVAGKLGLPSHTYESALNASNKVRMRKCFAEHGIPSPDFIEVTENEIPSFTHEKISAMKFPKVIKPVDNMGARGCRLVRNSDEFLDSLKTAVAYSRTGTAIVEDYMEGKEYSIDALVTNGNVIITGFADRHIFFEPYFIELGHTMPSEEKEEVKTQLCSVFSSAVKALGLTDGVAKGDIKYTSKGPMIGEIAARLSGGYMSGWTYPYASGLNLTKEAMKIALGNKPEFSGNEVPCTKFSHERAFISIPGIVSKIYGKDSAEGVPFIKNVFFRIKEGDSVDFPRNNVEKCGNVISCAPQRDLSLNCAEKAVSSIVLRLKPGCPATDDFLSGKELPSENGFPYSAFIPDEETAEKIKSILAKSHGVIPAGKPVLNFISEELLTAVKNLRDFNYRSIEDSLRCFDRIMADHPEFDTVKFFNVLLRGGIQGILYYGDSI